MEYLNEETIVLYILAFAVMLLKTAFAVMLLKTASQQKSIAKMRLHQIWFLIDHSFEHEKRMIMTAHSRKAK
jgi:hypothetical protein